MTQGNSTYVNGTSEKPYEPHTESERNGVTQKEPGAFRTISEVADEIHVPQHVLRFWETRFTQVQPIKRSGGRRYYRTEDIVLLKYISELLYVQGYTIKGVQKLLREDFSRFNKQDKAEEKQPLSFSEEQKAVSLTLAELNEESVPSEETEVLAASQESEAEKASVAMYLQEIERLKKENAFLTNSLRNILSELEELKKIILKG